MVIKTAVIGQKTTNNKTVTDFELRAVFFLSSISDGEGLTVTFHQDRNPKADKDKVSRMEKGMYLFGFGTLKQGSPAGEAVGGIESADRLMQIQ